MVESTINVNEFKGGHETKTDIVLLASSEVNAYLPGEDEAPMYFFKQVYSGEKQVRPKTFNSF